jgi:phospholipid/cholesterol/gamma-HCH transport system substrate-binding protein
MNMNNKVNYAFVGIFVLVGFFTMLSFGYWLLKPEDKEQMQEYIIHFDESVLGLNIDAPVKYRGIEVGRVKHLSINKKNSEQIEVLISVFKSTPIKVDTLAKLTSQGITGLSYINLSRGSNSSAMLSAKEGEKYPIIKTTPSLYNKLEDSFGSVSENLNNTLINANRVLSEENNKEFSLVLKNSSEFMNRMNRMLDDNTINNFHLTMSNLENTTKKLDELIPAIDILIQNSIKWEDNISASMFSIKNTYLGIGASMDEIKRAVSSGEFNFKEISKDVVPNINNTLIEMQQMMLKVEESLDRHNKSPSDILFKERAIKKGPGE